MRPTALIIDDDACMRELLAELLSSEGYRVNPAGSVRAMFEDTVDDESEWATLEPLKILHRPGIQMGLALRACDQLQ